MIQLEFAPCSRFARPGVVLDRGLPVSRLSITVSWHVASGLFEGTDVVDSRSRLRLDGWRMKSVG